MTRAVSGFWRWLKQPASWLSLSAALLSAVTFFLVHVNRGSLTVLLPDRVGVAYDSGGLAVVIPMVFTNTGAARTHRHVVEAAADLVFTARESEQRSVPLRWRYEVRFVSHLEFQRLYPDHPEAKADVKDHAAYDNQALPFHLAGGTSLAKVYRFEQLHQTPASVAGMEAFEIRVTTRTEAETLVVAGTYRCPAALNDKYWWCMREA